MVNAFADNGFGARSPNRFQAWRIHEQQCAIRRHDLYTFGRGFDDRAELFTYFSVRILTLGDIYEDVDTANDTAFRVAQHRGVGCKPESSSIWPLGDTFHTGCHLLPR
ncbi:MAG TPA: hypothetical protein VGK64_01220 [Bryobacteraceae bacterium]